MPNPISGTIDAARALAQLLSEAGFTIGAFNAEDLFDFGRDLIVKTIDLLLEKSIPLVGKRETKPPIKNNHRCL